MYKGILCGMAAFKQHCAFGFWKGSLIVNGKENNVDAMGQFGRITSLKDLPPKRVLLGYIKKAMQLNDEGVKAPRAKPQGGKKELTVPDYFTAVLKKNKKALATFEAFPYGKKGAGVGVSLWRLSLASLLRSQAVCQRVYLRTQESLCHSST